MGILKISFTYIYVVTLYGILPLFFLSLFFLYILRIVLVFGIKSKASVSEESLFKPPMNNHS
jgi:hypothetical protein